MKTQAEQERDMNARESSYISVIGYTPKESMPAHEWEAMLHRNEMSRGEYHGEHRHPRAT